MPRRWEFGRRGRVLALLSSLAFALVLSEIVLRLFFSREFFLDEKSLLYRYDEKLGWVPRPNSSGQFTACRTITIAHNSNGFRGDEWRKTAKPSIMFLGDSFVWGYDVEAEERFTEKLQAKHPEWTIYNLGVSGYGTDQEFLLLQRYFDELKPWVVFLVFCSDTDHGDNSWNVRCEGYFKPYYTVVDGGLELKGVPVPRGERAFLADHSLLRRSCLVRLLARSYYHWAAPPAVCNKDPTEAILTSIYKYVRERGALFAVGVEGPNALLEDFLQCHEIPYVDLTLDSPGPYRYSGFGDHWTPEGHTLVCGRIEELLREAHDNFGRIVAQEREQTEALRGVSKEPSLKPGELDLAGAHANFALLLCREGKLPEALAQVEEALRLSSRNPNYLRIKAQIFSKQERSGEAIETYREALQSAPTSPDTLNNLAWILATDPDPRLRDGVEAVRLAERACDLSKHKVARMVGTLAAAYAEARRFPEAVASARRAARLASAAGEKALAERNRQLLELYRTREPYHEAGQTKLQGPDSSR